MMKQEISTLSKILPVDQKSIPILETDGEKKALRPLSLRPARSVVRTKSLKPKTVSAFFSAGQKKD